MILETGSPPRRRTAKPPIWRTASGERTRSRHAIASPAEMPQASAARRRASRNAVSMPAFWNAMPICRTVRPRVTLRLGSMPWAKLGSGMQYGLFRGKLARLVLGDERVDDGVEPLSFDDLR